MAGHLPYDMTGHLPYDMVEHLPYDMAGRTTMNAYILVTFMFGCYYQHFRTP